jgi:hypothetical protein
MGKLTSGGYMLTFEQVSLSTSFALAFGLAYSAAFVWRRRERSAGPSGQAPPGI